MITSPYSKAPSIVQSLEDYLVAEFIGSKKCTLLVFIVGSIIPKRCKVHPLSY